MAKIRTTSIAEPWPALQPYLLGGHMLGPATKDDWKRQFAKTMMPLLMRSPSKKKKKKKAKPKDEGLLGGGF